MHMYLFVDLIIASHHQIYIATQKIRDNTYVLFVFFFNDPATTEIYTLSLHDALPICDFYVCVFVTGFLRW